MDLNRIAARLMPVAVGIAMLGGSGAWSRASAADLSSKYLWRPVRIGAGGWMRGLAIDPANPEVRFARGDVDNIYRWNAQTREWIPTKVKGVLPADVTQAPTPAGGGAIAIDPKNPKHILVAFTFSRSADLASYYPSFGLDVYRSDNGGLTFTQSALNLTGDLSSETSGERLAIDPNNSRIAYFGSPNDGLYRSEDGGTSWAKINTGGFPDSTVAAAKLPRFDATGGTVVVNGLRVSKIVYVTTDPLQSGSGGSIYRSSDGGVTWTPISSGQPTDHGDGFSVVGQDGNFWTTTGDWTGNLYEYSRAGSWSTHTTPHGGVAGIAIDPRNVKRMFVMSGWGGTLARSLDGGNTWTDLGGSLVFSETQPIQWLRPSPIRPQGHYVSNSGLYLDENDNLLAAAANDGIILTRPNDKNDSSSNPPVWTSISEGIEEMVAQTGIIPPGGKPILTVLDETLFTIDNPNAFTAKHYPLNLWQKADGSYNNGLSSAQDANYSPNAPQYAVVTSDNSFAGEPKTTHYSGYTNDFGQTWNFFPSIANLTHPCILTGGVIAVSARQSGHENDPAGSDNLVWAPTLSNIYSVTDPNGNAHYLTPPAPFYSNDGGATWHQTNSFASVSGITAQSCAQYGDNTAYQYLDFQWGPWINVLKQHLLIADPVTPGTFYWHSVSGGFYRSTDGGVTWKQTPGSSEVVNRPHHGKMEAVRGRSGDIWLVDGYEGADTHGLWHTQDGGDSWTKDTNFQFAWALALGKGAPNADYPAIYVYGKLFDDARWGIFQSVDQGKTWNRISGYPYGLIDRPSSLAASYDKFGTVYIGFDGNSYYYATYLGEEK